MAGTMEFAKQWNNCSDFILQEGQRLEQRLKTKVQFDEIGVRVQLQQDHLMVTLFLNNNR